MSVSLGNLRSAPDPTEVQTVFAARCQSHVAHTKTEHGMMVLRHGGAPLMAESGVGRLPDDDHVYYYIGERLKLEGKTEKGWPTT